ARRWRASRNWSRRSRSPPSEGSPWRSWGYAVPRKTKPKAPLMPKITQIRSGVGRPEAHKRTLKALGLRHQRSALPKDSPAIRGMIFQVRHLVKVEELEGGEG